MPGAYYNENEPVAAQWLRNLIAAGIIAPGDVDERDIRSVRADDLRGYVQFHFFAGIGVWSYALRQAGWPDDRRVWTGSCPCQPFSSAGRQGGLDDERHLWPYWRWLALECGAESLFGEQVASADGLAWLDFVCADLEAAGYRVGALDTCAAGFGAPHIRQRLYFVADTRGGGVRGGPEPRADARAEEEVRGETRQQRLRPDAGADVAAGDLADAAVERRLAQRERRASPAPAREGERRVGPGHGRRLGDASSGGRRERGDAALEGSGGHADGAGDAQRVGDAQRARLEGHPGHGNDGHEPGRQRTLEAGPAPAAGADGRVADAEHDGWRADEPGRRSEGRAAHGRVGETVADADSGEDGRLHEGRPNGGGAGELPRPGPTNGFWRAAEWIPCVDGKARPVEPGTFPLAHGITGRVGRLRAYGNAINAEAARWFIAAYLEETR